MGMLKTTTTVITGNELDKFLAEVKKDHSDACFEMAQDGARAARSRIKDKTGNLRAHTRASRSKFGPEGGAIVLCDAKHAHLVEYGHVLIIGGEDTKDGNVGGVVTKLKNGMEVVPPHPFMRPSRNDVASNLEEVVAMIIGRKNEGR